MADPQVDDVYDNVTSLSISPDGNQVVFGTINGALTLWDTYRCQHICAPIMAHQSVINSVCYSVDGRLIASASDDQTIALWDASTGQSVRDTFTSHEDGVLVVGFMADARTVVSLSRGRIVFVWQATTGEVEKQFRISLDARSLAALSQDSEKLLAAHRRGITVWNTVTMERTMTVTLGGPMVLCMGLSPDTTKVALGMADNSISLWDLERGEVDSPHLEGGKELPLYVTWSPDGRTVSSVAQDATLRVWSVDSRQLMPESHRTMGPMTYSPSSNFIVCPGDDGSPDTWDVPQAPYDSTFIVNMPATAASTHHTAGATESDVFRSLSGDPQAPVMSTHHAQNLRKPDSPPVLNTSSKTKGFFFRILQRLSARGRESGAIPTTECGIPANLAPETRRGMPRSRRTTATQHPRPPDIIDGVSDESEVSVVPGCSLCRRG